MKITLSTSGIIGINLINKLFDLQYVPSDLEVWCAWDKSNRELIEFCQLRKIPVSFINDATDFDKVSVNGDLLLSVVGIPLLIPNQIIEQFPLKAINLHPADTEKYRGRWMVSWCLINQETNVGYTWHYMNNRYDTGNILLKHDFLIDKNDTALSLNARIFSHAVHHLQNLLDLVGTLGTPPATFGTYYNQSIPYQGKIQQNWSEEEIDRFVRAMYHPPYTPAIFEKNGQLHLIESFQDYYIAQRS